MRPLYTFALLAALAAANVAAPTLAHADTVFSFTGASIAAPYASPVTGTVTINTTAGTISAYSFSTEGDTFTGTGTSITSNRADNLFEYTMTAGDADKVLLYMPGSLVGYTGALCTNAASCTETSPYGFNLGTLNSLFQFANQTSFTNFAAGSLTINQTLPGASTPEPSSFLLLGTGILGLVSAARRRLSRA